MRRSKHLLAISALLFMLHTPRLCMADEKSSPSRAVVLLIAQGTPAHQMEAALAAIRSQVADVPVQVVVKESAIPRGDMRAMIDLATELARSHAAVGTFWLDLDRENDLLLYLAEPEGARLLVRRIQSSKGSEGAALEEVALITRYAVTALLEGGQIGMQAVPIAPPPATTRPVAAQSPFDTVKTTSSEPPQKRLRLGANYSGQSWSSGLGWENGLRMFGAYDAGRSWYVGVSYAFEAPLVVETPGASARIVRHPAEAILGGRLSVGFASLAGELAIEIDAQTRSTTTASAGLAKTPNDTAVTVSVSPRGGLAKQLLGRAELFGLVGAEYVVNPTAYVLFAPAREPLAAPGRWRARVDLGVSVAVW